ncbi:MAG: response regulator transcription factor [Phycisphaerales bacterium]
MPISVLLVDDNEMLAEAMPRLLARDARFEWAGWIEDPANLVETVRAKAPGVVLMDVDMPGVETFDLVKLLAAECPKSRVVMFSGHVREDYAEAAIDAGAFGYLHKDDEVGELLNNLERVSRGEVVLSPLVKRTLWRK